MRHDMMHKFREVLWKKPELIDEYINEAELPQEKIDILKLWRTKHKKEMLFIWSIGRNTALCLLRMNKVKTDFMG